MKGKLSLSADSLLHSFHLYDKALVLFFKNNTYFYLRSAVNTKDKQSQEEASSLDADFNKRTAFFETELEGITESKFAEWSKQNPELEKFRFAVFSALRFKPHRMSFFASSYQGFYNDVRMLTHESTHAIHRQLMKTNNVLPVYAEGPHYLFESFAMFNELLLPDFLYQNEKDPSRAYYLEQFFDGKGMALFSIALDAALEQEIYDGVQKGNIRNADDLDNVTEKITRQYSIWADKHKELRMRWITNSLFYEDPIYQINYVYGALLALKYYSMFLNKPNSFVPRYIALMKNGFNAPPEELLKKFLDIDLNDPRLLTDDVDVLTHKVNLLEQEYGPRTSRPH
ncbi:MAG TPA: M3 family metallopeptidase [Acidobacteriota bacterium]|nr:M3 family metallopeptidase [Acidobacteriota bacterium]